MNISLRKHKKKYTKRNIIKNIKKKTKQSHKKTHKKSYKKKHINKKYKKRLQFGGLFNSNEKSYLQTKIKELFPDVTDEEINIQIQKLDKVSQIFQGENGVEQFISQMETIPKNYESLRQFVDETVNDFEEDVSTDVEDENVD